jgi:hypothetical protein
MEQEVSDRLLDQRLRNRMMEELLCLVDWEEALEWGAGEYFNNFFDFFPDKAPLYPNTALSDEESDALAAVLNLVDAAAKSTSQHVTADELITSGWPQKIKPAAAAALALMSRRGRFSEEHEEAVPSTCGPWPKVG